MLKIYMHQDYIPISREATGGIFPVGGGGMSKFVAVGVTPPSHGKVNSSIPTITCHVARVVFLT